MSEPKKNVPFYRVLILDALFWGAIYASLQGSEGAENILTFMVSATFAMLLGLFALKGIKREYEPVPKWRATYVGVTTFFECAAFAWLGWFGIAFMHLGSAIFGSIVRDKMTIEKEIPQ